MTRGPNFVFYVSDSLRADHLSCYGYDRETSPNVDRLAADGLRFDRMYSQAYKTVESSVSILTGLYPPTHGAQTTYDVIPDDVPRIASRLSDAGYATAGFSTLVQISERRNFDKGFDTFEELFRTSKAENGPTDWARVCTDRAIEWLDNLGDEPFFLFLWSNGTHDPYAPRANVFTDEDQARDIDGSLESLREMEPDQAPLVRDLYDDTIRHSDTEFGRLLDYLEETGRYDGTAVVFTGDHGELLSEHGRMERAYAPLRLGLRTLAPELSRRQTLFEPGAFVGHLATDPYDELTHVPGVIKPPAGDASEESRSALVETVDLMPTVADLAGVSLETQGESLRPLFDSDESFKKHVYSDTAISRGIVQSRSVRSDEYKLIRTEWAPHRLRSRKALEVQHAVFSALKKTMCQSEVLFELPDERTDVSGTSASSLRSLRATLDQWITECESWSYDTRSSELDDETERQLRELGYLN